MTIRQISTRLVYRNAWMLVREDEVERNNGTRGIFGVVEKPDSAIILPINGDEVYLVEQYRYALGVNSIEFPQGSLERNDVDPEMIARDELLAETGLIANKFEYLGKIHIACGYTNQRTFAFVATGLTQSTATPDAEEHDIAVHRLRLTELGRLIREDHIRDAQTLAAWALYQSHLASSQEKP